MYAANELIGVTSSKSFQGQIDMKLLTNSNQGLEARVEIHKSHFNICIFAGTAQMLYRKTHWLVKSL
jgi:hypothetical protein